MHTKHATRPLLDCQLQICFFFYLVGSGDRLLLVERQVDLDTIHFVPTRLRIEVFEAADLNSGVVSIGQHGGGAVRR